MRRPRFHIILSVLFTLLTIEVARSAAAQDMLPVFGTPDQPAESAKPAPVTSPQVSAPAQAVIPLASTAALAAPVKKPSNAPIDHPAPPRRHVATAAEQKKFAALMKRLAPTHRETVHHQIVRRVVVHEPRPDLPPPGTFAPPPGYYPPGPYYQHLVYAAPYPAWGGGFRGPYPYYDYP